MATNAGKGLKVKFWGVRGSIPCPGPSTAHYGGNTACIQVLGGSEIIVLDAGTGLRELGLELAKRPGPLRIHLLLTHTHWDHIQGFPFFTPIYSAGNEIFVYGPKAMGKSLEEALMVQMQYSFFPVRGVELAATMHFMQVDDGPFHIGDLEVAAKPMNHPIQVFAYKISSGKASCVYSGDNEPYYDIVDARPGRPDTNLRRRDEFIKERNDEVVQFVRGSDLLIADAQYTDEEYEKKRGWGHSSVGSALELATKAGVKKLAIFHHEPTHDDRKMAEIEKQTVARAAKIAPKLQVVIAREGMCLDV